MFNFVHNYKANTYYSDDKLGGGGKKKAVLYLGKQSNCKQNDFKKHFNCSSSQ